MPESIAPVVPPDVPAEIHLSVLIPVRDEEASIAPLTEALLAVLDRLGRPAEILFIDDGSRDGTLKAIRAAAAQDRRVRFRSLRMNFGKAAALAIGFEAVRGERVITMDGDLQDDPEEIPRLLARLDEEYDLVSGWKFPRHDPPSKTWPSRIFNFMVRRTTGIPLHDFNCGLKAYRAEVVKGLPLYGELHRYIPVLAAANGYRIGELRVKHHPRRFGRSKYGLERMLRGMFDLLTVLFLTRYSRRPLHVFGGAGLLCTGLGGAILVYLTILKIGGHPIGHRPFLTLGVLLTILGVQWVTFGFLGEMLANLNRQRLPINAVRERSPEEPR